MKIDVKVFHNLNINALVEGYKDGDVLVPVEDLVFFKINPTIEYTCNTILGQTFEIMNDASSRHRSELLPSHKAGNSSLSVGDVIYVVHPSRGVLTANEVVHFAYAVEEHGFRLLHG